ncbi:PLP-dependent transferase [Tilletiaria anomala UBC 951]|uniref:PLP-dependent transferase n=1 Tax=Tilletiaria anomala (strain ATCC 24038 / CBS 436.72 / UBC 951) TaxID=1037660 RepID=A0A066W786_TILAU|nr:PLP-dependent transferase [Tilletiaria anomala UBC 951]KDN46655.1 PLP-dependent transferase [Tilletiaria anomala UBC 951]
MPSTIPIGALRPLFPAIFKNSEYIFAENAGGSQVLGSVVDCISDYLLTTNVQMGNYALAQSAGWRVDQGLAAAAFYAHASSTDEVMVGASATQLAETLSRMIEETVIKQRAGMYQGQEPTWEEGDEIIISQADHEANRGAWKRLAARQNLVIKEWPVTKIASQSERNLYAVELSVAALAPLLTPRTRLVAFTGCSNVLGGFTPVAEAARLVKERTQGRAYVAIDAVALAPHRPVRPASGEWKDVDFVLWSWYKVYGPHTGSLYIAPRASAQLLSKLNHHFLHGSQGSFTFQPSSRQYELIASIKVVVEYLAWLGEGPAAGSKPKEIDWASLFGDDGGSGGRKQVQQSLHTAFALVAAHEESLLHILIGFLTSEKMRSRGVRIVGSESAKAQNRAPTVSFVIAASGGKPAVRSAELCAAVNKKGKFGAQLGHMYAYALVDALGLTVDDGVVRVSLVHYNTVEEAKEVCKEIEEAIDSFA